MIHPLHQDDALNLTWIQHIWEWVFLNYTNTLKGIHT